MLDNGNALSVLSWWQGAGFDTAIAEEPCNWLALGNRPAVAAPPSVIAPAPSALPASLAAFHRWIDESDVLPDRSRRGRRILPSGDPAGLMVMIDMPEPADATAGRLLSDDSGLLFDRMLAAIGRSRETIYLASLCLERPMGGRADPETVERLGQIARHHIALAAPKGVLLMGQAVSRAVLGIELLPARGKLHSVNQDDPKMAATATFAPRFLIQNPARKADAWRDLRLLTRGMDA